MPTYAARKSKSKRDDASGVEENGKAPPRAGKSGAARKRFSGAAPRPHGRRGKAGCKVRSAYFADCVRLNGMRSVERSGLRGRALVIGARARSARVPGRLCRTGREAADLYQDKRTSRSQMGSFCEKFFRKTIVLSRAVVINPIKRRRSEPRGGK